MGLFHPELEEKWYTLSTTKIVLASLLLLTLVAGIWYTFFFQKGTEPSSLKSAATEEAVLSNNGPVIKASSKASYPVYGISTSLQLHSDVRKTIGERGGVEGIHDALQASGALSRVDIISGSLLSQHLERIRIIRNSVLINILDLLSGTTSRAQTLDRHLETLNEKGYQAQTSRNELEAEINILKAELQKAEAERDIQKNTYNQALTDYDAVAAENALNNFIVAQADASELYTLIQAYGKFVSVYNGLLDGITLKIATIQANREALVNNIRVVAIEGMQEKLIISANEWRATLSR